MSKHLKILLGKILEDFPLTLEELSRAAHADVQTVTLLIEYNIIQPSGNTPHTWRFRSLDLYRTKKAIALQKDLELNMAAIGVVLDLLDEIQHLREEIEHSSKA
jgi:chaperone modulatory protein CbpM